MTDDMMQPLGAQISAMLKDRGVEVIFGIPGVHNQELYRGIEQAGLTHVLARHEQGAGFMADGYARATGRPGVAYVITGPGLCNIMTPMGQAYSDDVPVLVISSCLADVTGRKGQLHQMIDQRAAAATVCDWSEEARDAATAYRQIDRALGAFAAGARRPKHLQVTIPALEASARLAPPAPKASGPMPPDPVAVADVAARVTAARKPLLILGGGAAGLGADRAARLLRAGGFASFTTYAGRGIVPPGMPLHFGSYLARPDSARMIAAADLVLVIGSELAEVDLWRDHAGHHAPMIRVDHSQDRLGQDVGAAVNVRSDAIRFVDALLAELAGREAAKDWKPEEVAQARAKWRAEVDAGFPGVLGVAEALRAALPEDAMIYSDMTQFAYAAKEVWDMPRPGHWHHPYGFGTLGYALPAAIGGAVGRPGLPTLAIAGDYGFQYTLPELGVAVELGLPLPILLWDNGKLGAIEDSMVGAQIAPKAVVARNPDFLALARAYGAAAVAPGNLAELCEAVNAAFAAKGPTLIRMTPDLA